MDELLKAIDGLKKAYKASGAKYLHIKVADDRHIDLVEVVNSDGKIVLDTEFTEMQDKPITNGEWLRGLSDDGLARVLSSACRCDYCGYRRVDGCCGASAPYCESGCLNWLQLLHTEHKE